MEGILEKQIRSFDAKVSIESSLHRLESMDEIEKPLKLSTMSQVVQAWYADYVNVDQALLFELILAANYMDIMPLLDLTCATFASMIKGKTPENSVILLT